jgi:hypothetical protein
MDKSEKLLETSTRELPGNPIDSQRAHLQREPGCSPHLRAVGGFFGIFLGELPMLVA